jgi:RimJ/RimL family protein N-acetyltransferase
MIKCRPHLKNDIPYHVQWFNNPKAKSFISDEGDKKTTLEKETKWFNNYQKDNNKKFFTILDDNLPIGCVGLMEIDKKHKQAELFIIIGNNEYRGRGVGKQSLEYIIDYGFEKLKLHKND